MKATTAMRLSHSIVLSSLCYSAAAAATGHIFVYDPFAAKADPAQSPTVSPETARLILAQRLGLAQYHATGGALGDDVIDLLNAVGGQQHFFADARRQEQASAQALVWIDGVEDVDAIIKERGAYSAHLTISDPPATAAHDRLVQDLAAQAHALPKRPDPLGWTYHAGNEIRYALQHVNKADIYNDFLSVLRIGGPDTVPNDVISAALAHLLERSSSAGQKGWPVTVVLMPPSSADKGVAHPYGQYRTPSSLSARRENPEAFLSLSSSQPSSRPQGLGIEDAAPVQHVNGNGTSPVLGILPPYFSSEEDCIKRTHNCSDHGVCRRPHKNRARATRDGPKAERFVCVCAPTVQHVGEDHGMESKQKVTYWGGPACQKKDVSQPFWLLAGTGIALAFLISAGIGMMYSMGDEELPSVIGAGVSGPVRK